MARLRLSKTARWQDELGWCQLRLVWCREADRFATLPSLSWFPTVGSRRRFPALPPHHPGSSPPPPPSHEPKQLSSSSLTSLCFALLFRVLCNRLDELLLIRL